MAKLESNSPVFYKNMKRENPDLLSAKNQVFFAQIRNIRLTVGCTFGGNN